MKSALPYPACSPVHKAAIGQVDPAKGISIRCCAVQCRLV